MSLREKNVKMNKTKLKLFGNLLYNNYKEQQKSIINNDSTTSKNEKINFPDIYSGLNKITPIKKQSINNSQEKNINIKKINKMFISNKSNNSLFVCIVSQLFILIFLLQNYFIINIFFSIKDNT